MPLEDAVDHFVTEARSLVPAATRRVFISSAAYQGNMGGLAGADAKCQSLADAADIGGTWIAWLSTDTINAVERMTPAKYVAMGGATVIADSLSELVDGGIDSNIVLDAAGSPVFLAIIFTGTLRDGTSSDVNCMNWTDGTNASSGVFGKNDYPPNGPDWTDNDTVSACSSPQHIYCFER